MRVLMISKACVTASYRSKIAYLADVEDLDIGLVVPDHWANLSFEPDVSDDRYPIYRRAIPFNGRNHFHWYPGLGDIIRTFRPDLLHVDEEHYSVVTGQGITLAKTLGVPSIFFTWQNIYKRYPWPFSAIEQRVFRGSAGAIAGNQEALEVLRQKGFQKPAVVIPQFGTDLSLFGPKEKPRIKAEWEIGEATTVGYVGRLIEDKGLDELMEAMSPLLRQDRDLGLLFVGSGPYETLIERWMRTQGVEQQVHLIPWVASEAMPDVMNLIDILVLPSRTTPRWKEQFGRVLTEAMACGDIVIGSNSGEIPHVIGEAGLVFPERDAEALKRAIIRVVENSDLQRTLRNRGFERVAAHFTQKAVADKTYQFYRQILEDVQR